jgi:mannose-6-phosphate isomerase-like protein (cupin superfamily)
MTVVTGATAPVFEMNGTRFTGLASPLRGASETGAWRIAMAAATPPFFHRMTREEILVATAGGARLHIGGVERDVAAGDCVIVPADTEFAISNPHATPFEAVVILPVGGTGVVAGEYFDPPWAA